MVLSQKMLTFVDDGDDIVSIELKISNNENR